jgi:hypothetical protein
MSRTNLRLIRGGRDDSPATSAIRNWSDHQVQLVTDRRTGQLTTTTPRDRRVQIRELTRELYELMVREELDRQGLT